MARATLRRLARRLALNPLFRRIGRLVVPRLDRALHRLSRGRWHLADAVADTLVLKVRGRRSGQLRTTPLVYARDEGSYLVVGSNWGRPEHPVWTENLLAAGGAEIEVGGRRIRVHARLLEGAERDRAWARCIQRWPAWQDYLALTGGRSLRVFRLEPVPDEA